MNDSFLLICSICNSRHLLNLIINKLLATFAGELIVALVGSRSLRLFWKEKNYLVTKDIQYMNDFTIHS